jgi:hypothetical protein
MTTVTISSGNYYCGSDSIKWHGDYKNIDEVVVTVVLVEKWWLWLQ